MPHPVSGREGEEPGRGHMDTEWIELWVDHDGAPGPVPLRVCWSPGTTVGEVSRALSARLTPAVGGRPVLVGVDPPTGPLPGDAPVERSGLQRGHRVRLAATTVTSADPAGGHTTGAMSGDITDPTMHRTTDRTTVMVRRGPNRGRRVALGDALVVGRSPDCDLTLDDPAVSRRHVRLTRRQAVVELEPLADSVVGVSGRHLRSCEPVEPGTPIRVGDSELVVIAPTRRPPPTSAGATPTSTRPHQRPPRAPFVSNPPTLDLPEPPRRTGVGTVPWLSVGLTGAFAVVMVMGGGFGGGVTANLIWFFTPLLLASGAIEYALSARRGDRRARRRWRAELTDRCAELDRLLDDEARRATHAAPPPADWLLAARLGTTRLWERRREHDDALRLRVGLCNARVQVTGGLPTAGPADLLAEAAESVDRVRWRQDVVSCLDLAEVGSIGLHGPDAHALAASLTAQLVAALGPEDVAIAVAVGATHAARWRWVSMLPHLRSAAELLGGPATAGCAGHDRLVGAIGALGAARLRRSDGPGPHGNLPLVAVLDGELAATIEVRRLAALCRLAEAGIHVLWLDGRPSLTPMGCGATATTARRGLATVVPRPGAVPHRVRWEPVAPEQLDRLGRHLAPRRDGDRAGTGAGLPASVSLASLGAPDPNTLAATVGIGPDGPVTIDLRRDGPHALVAGTTGAGKSELLRTLVAALAMARSPQRLNLVLVDFKGGTGMGPLANLPHVAGMITDLDPGEANRLRLGLEAEVDRRLRVLASAGVENLAALERSRPTEAPPAIVVVIDEFAALARQAPAVLDGLVDLAQRGRSLGIHLVLATQRPRGVISDAIRANTNLRLVARMADVEESIDVLDDPAAAHLPVGVPGRVLMRVGAAPPTPVQVAFTGTPTAHRSAVAVMPLTLDPPPGGPPTVAPATARPPVTEADAVVRATQTAARDRRADRLWLEPLPTRLSDPTVVAGEDGRHLLDRAAPDAAQVRATTGWPLAVADLPRRRARAVWSLDPAGGVVLVLGGAGSGRTSALEAIAATAAGHGAGAVGIDGAGGRLAGLDGATAEHRTGAAAESGGDARPGLGAFVAVSDDERLARLLWWLEQRGGATPCVLAIDGWEGVWDRGQLPGASDVIVRLVELARTARARRLTVAVGAGRAGALPPELRSARSELVALAGAERDPDLGLDHPPPSGAPPGRARLVTAQAHLLGGESDPTEGPLVQLRRPPPPSAGQGRNDGGSHPAVATGDAPLVAPHPARIRLEVGLETNPGPNPDVGSPSTDSGRHDPGVIVGVDLERDLPVVAPATGPFWVLGRPRSGRSTTLATLAAQATAGRPGGRVLVSARAPIGPTQHPWTTTLEAPARLHDGLPGPVTSVALVAIDDADRLDDDGWAALDRWLGALPGQGRDPLLAVAADPAALDRWNPVVSSLLGHGSGLLLSPEPDEDGRLLGGDLPRHRPFAMSAGRGYLVVRGTGARPVQVAWPHA